MNNLAQLPTPAVMEKSADILGRVRQAFADKGFDGASMQDLARTAGMSVGNFYRYFPSKAAIVEAMVHHDMAEIERDFAAILSSDDPLAGLRQKLTERLGDDCGGDGRLWAEITAASHRKPEIARISQAMEEVVAGRLLTVFARLTGLSAEACYQRFGTHARFIIFLVKASVTRNASAPEPDLQAMVLQSIETTLAEVVAAAHRD